MSTLYAASRKRFAPHYGPGEPDYDCAACSDDGYGARHVCGGCCRRLATSCRAVELRGLAGDPSYPESWISFLEHASGHGGYRVNL